MHLSVWLVYVAAVLVLTVTPGPSVLMCISTSVQHGPRRAVLAAMGSTFAIACIMVLSMLGLGSVLAASDNLFSVLKLLGAAYLAYLGISALLRKDKAIVVPTGSTGSASARALFARGFWVGASNPKALLFFGALFPQFINPEAPHLPQFAILGTTFVFFEMLWLTFYATLAGRARRWLEAPHRAVAFNRFTGGVFLVAAGFLATTKRNAV